MPFLRFVEKYCSAEEIKDEHTLSCINFACWVNRATNAHLDHVILIAFSRQQRLREGASMIRLYVHCLSSSHVLLKTSYQFR